MINFKKVQVPLLHLSRSLVPEPEPGARAGAGAYTVQTGYATLPFHISCFISDSFPVLLLFNLTVGLFFIFSL